MARGSLGQWCRGPSKWLGTEEEPSSEAFRAGLRRKC